MFQILAIVFLVLFLTACDRVKSAQQQITDGIESPLQNTCQPIDGFARHIPVCR